MADGTQSEGEGPSIHPKLAEFLEQTFAKDGRRHTLVLGEIHSINDHTLWLEKHLSELQAHGVNTIGYELPTFMNVFLWAYGDGTLAHELGGQQQAKAYIRAMWQTAFGAEYKTAADLLTGAIDHGMHAMCYDTRDTMGNREESESMNEFFERYPEKALRKTALFTRPDKLVLNNDNETYSPAVGFRQSANLYHELYHLLQGNPNYSEKLHAINALVRVGHRLASESRIGGDGLSACMLQAMTPDAGNSIIINGAAHNLGAFAERGTGIDEIRDIHGMLAHHLQEVAEGATGCNGVDACAPRNHRVTTAVLTGTANREYYQRVIDPYQDASTLVIPSAIPLVTLEKGEQYTLTSYGEDDARRFSSDDAASRRYSDAPLCPEEQWFLGGSEVDEIACGNAYKFANPMLIPELKRASAAVHALMHGEPTRVR